MILVYTGRRPSAGDGQFPAQQQSWLAERLNRLLAGLRPRTVVGSAAAGADLLVLQAALRAGSGAEVILTEDIDAFRAVSVADKGQEWGTAFDAVVSRDGVHVDCLPVSADDAGFSLVNDEIIARAQAALGDEEELLAVGVSAGRRDGQDHTENLLTAMEAAGRLVLRLDPSKRRADTPTAFVAMPYGIRPAETQETRDYNADATWHRVLAPALLGAGYRPVRADMEASLELIDAKMIRAIGEADVFVADLAQHNPNVFWEVGLRHAWSPRGTLLIKPSGSPRPPFDVNHVPVHTYRRDPDTVTDRDAVQAIRAIIEVLAAPRQTDSPVFAALPALKPPLIPPTEDQEAETLVTRFAERISLATDLREGQELVRLATDLPATLPTSTRDALREQAGLALSDLKRHEDAIQLLQPLAEADEGFTRVRLQQRYALALMHAAKPAEGRLERLLLAALRLQRLHARHPGSPETLGLLGGAAKRAFQQARASGDNTLTQLDRAIVAYEAGYVADPTDYFPGINAIALLRVRGQLIQPGQPLAAKDLARARDLIPVVRFSLARPQAAKTPWLLATLGELCLHDHLLGGPCTPDDAVQHYTRAAQRANVFEASSIAEQLRMLRALGDPKFLIDPLLDVFQSSTS